MILICDNGPPYNIRKYKLVLLIPLFIFIILCFYNGSEFYKQGILSKVEDVIDTHNPPNKETLSDILNITQIIYNNVQRLGRKVQRMYKKLQLIDNHSQTNKQISSEIVEVTQTIHKKIQRLNKKVQSIDKKVQRTDTHIQTNKQTASEIVKVTQIMNEYVQKNSKCYADPNFVKNIGLFPLSDILLTKRKPTKDKTIFFHETKCSKDGKLRLNARQACGIESAALLNPNFDIFVLFASPVARSDQNETGVDFDILEALSDYKNIYYRNVNLWRYTRDTAIQNWFDEGHLLKSRYIKEHLSDFLRYLTLWRWGGTHLDLDIILKQTLENITTNFVGAQEQDLIHNAVINLSYKDTGHEIASILLKYVEIYYNPNQLMRIGSYLLTDVFKKICKTDKIALMTPERCSGIKIFDQKFFYAIGYNRWELFFQENDLEEAMRLTSESIAIHLWNTLSKNTTVKVNSEVAYGIYADKYCPKVYSSCEEFF